MTGDEIRADARVINAAISILKGSVGKPRPSELDLLVAKLTALADRLHRSAARADDRQASKL